jgi:N-acetylmuramoyl-L-alanine amidase
MRGRNRLSHKYLTLLFVIFGLIVDASFPSSGFSAVTARDKYFLAEACYKDLRQAQTKQRYRHNWIRCIRKFQAVYRHNPSGPWAAAGLYQSGRLYQGLHKQSGRKADEREALDIYRRIIKRFPNSKYRKKATIAIGSIPDARGQTEKQLSVVKKRKKPVNAKNPGPERKKEIPSAPSTISRANITGLRYWSNPNYTRIVIDADKSITYRHHLLKKDPSLKKPQRLYVDLDNSLLGNDTQKIIPINDEHLVDTRAGQYSPESVRVVVDIKSFSTYKIFSLKNPFRIVLDVWGSSKKKRKPARHPVPVEVKVSDIPDSALAKQFALGVKTIVIDPGHGGRDFGAPGYLKGVHEKNIALAIAKRLAVKIRKTLKCKVIMTRRTDRYLTLEERTAIANTQNADLFISIHTNSTRNRRAFGIETYFLNLATDEESIRVAARENATSEKNISDLQTILNDLMQNAKINESSRLAAHVQTSLYSRMRKHYTRIKNLGVKQAPFYVLLGAQMPSVLIETSFTSNARECKRLITAKYQQQLCVGIVNGIRNYIKETNPLSLLGSD